MFRSSCLSGIVIATLCTPGARGSETVLLKGPVRIATSADRNIFAESWRSTRINARAESLTAQETERSKRILTAAFDKYPPSILTANLEAVYVLHRLRYFGISASGTNSRNRIYLANRGVAHRFTDVWVEGTFHAEFSSILLRNYARHFNVDTWKAINSVGFKYGSSGVEAVRNGMAGKHFDAELHADGFLYEYAQSSFENDFNSIAEQIFLGTRDFWLAVNRHDRLHRKTRLVIHFYRQIDPSFNRLFFDSIAREVDAGHSNRRTRK